MGVAVLVCSTSSDGEPIVLAHHYNDIKSTVTWSHSREGTASYDLEWVFIAAHENFTGATAGIERIHRMAEVYADSDLVVLPINVDRTPDEVVDMMDARRVFEANATVFQSAKQMLRRAIDI